MLRSFDLKPKPLTVVHAKQFNMEGADFISFGDVAQKAAFDTGLDVENAQSRSK
jgi:hypothetical protein